MERRGDGEYLLTRKGRELGTVIVALTEWGDRWAAPQGAPVLFEHEGCGGPIHVHAGCDDCGREPAPADVVAVAGPGADPQLYRPRPELAGFVEYFGYWQRETGEPHRSRALPRGAATVIIDVSGRQRVDFYAADGHTRLKVPPAFIAGAGTASYVTSIDAPQAVVTIHFRPAGALPFLGVPLGELEISAPPSSADEACISQMAFNPANGFRPLGITHARKDVYAASAANRKDRGLLSGEAARAFLQDTAARP